MGKQPATLSLFQYADFAKTLGTREKYREHCTRFGCTKTPILNGNSYPFSKTLQGNARYLQPLGERRVRATAVPVSEQSVDVEKAKTEKQKRWYREENPESNGRDKAEGGGGGGGSAKINDKSGL